MKTDPLTYWILMSALLAVIVAMAAIVCSRALRRQEIAHARLVQEELRHVMVPAQPLMLMPPVASEMPKYDAAAGDRWVAEARDAAIAIANVTGEVTADHVWEVCPPPAGVDGRLMSIVFSKSEWEIGAYVHSSRGRNSARQIAVWRRKSDAARAA